MYTVRTYANSSQFYTNTNGAVDYILTDQVHLYTHLCRTFVQQFVIMMMMMLLLLKKKNLRKQIMLGERKMLFANVVYIWFLIQATLTHPIFDVTRLGVLSCSLNCCGFF